MTNSDWINLATAIGTFAAVVVALFLAGVQERKSKSEALARAQLCAAAMSYRLKLTADIVSACSGWGVFHDLTTSRETSDIKALAEIRKILRRTFFTPSADELTALIPLGNSCAHRIARAYDYITSVRQQIDALGEGMITEIVKDASTRKYLLERWSGELMAASDLLATAIRDCSAATELGAPRPTGQELHGDSD